MYDTVDFYLSGIDIGGIDLLSEIPCYIEQDTIVEHRYKDGTTIEGRIKGLKVRIREKRIKVFGGSLCKWYFGDNYKTMTREDARRAIERLSDTLHLPLDKAKVSRLDVAQNVILENPVNVYLNHLGELRYTKRMEYRNGLYYEKKRGMKLCFYDKNKEQRAKQEPIQEEYKGKNVLRYEQRYTARLGEQLKCKEVTGKMLFTEEFYNNIVVKWFETYRAINKIHDTAMNFEAIKTKRDLYKMGIISLAERFGGELGLLEQIKEAQTVQKINKMQARGLRTAVKNALEEDEILTAYSEAIKELDARVEEAAKQALFGE